MARVRHPRGTVAAKPVAAIAMASTPVIPAEAIATDHAEVLPDPALIAQPGAPLPIVTASPPLAAEPTAIDAVKAEVAAQVGEFVGFVDATEQPISAMLGGQTMLAVEAAGTKPIEPVASISSAVTDAIESAIYGSGTPLRRNINIVEVVGPVQGRRRAGNMFGPQPRRFRYMDFSEAELQALRDDPMLAVSVNEVEVTLDELYGPGGLLA